MNDPHVECFQRNNGNLAKTARELGVSRDTLRLKLVVAGVLDIDARRKAGGKVAPKPQDVGTSIEELQPPPLSPDTLKNVLHSGAFTIYQLCEKLNTGPVAVRQGLVELEGVKRDGDQYFIPQPEIPAPEVKFEIDGNTAEASYVGRKPVSTLEELLEVAKVDLTIWTVEEFTVNQWEMGYVQSKVTTRIEDTTTMQADPGSRPLFQVKARLRRIKLLPLEFEPIAPVQVEIFHRVQPHYEPSEIRRCAVIPDIQVGYRRDLMHGALTSFHDRAVIDVGLQMLADMKPDVVVFLGDNADLPEWSAKFLVTPECRQLTQTTLVELAWIYGKVRAICPQAEIHVIEGNHDARMKNAVTANLSQAYGLRAVDQLHDEPALAMERLLNLKAIDVQYHGSYPQGKYRLNSNFLFHHGEVVRGQSGKTVAAVANDLRRNEGFGHIHRVECASKTMWTAEEEPKVYQAWSFGTWASILPGRVPGAKSEQNWQNGMGAIDYEVNSDGEDGLHDLATVTPIVIYKDTAIYQGKRYKARDEREIVSEIVGETGWDVQTGFFHRKSV